MQSTISGAIAPALSIALNAGEEINAQAGALMYMTGGVTLSTEMKGGLMGGLKRMVSGESAFLTKFAAEGQGGTVGLAPSHPGSIQEIQITGGRTILAERGAYLCSSTTVETEVAFQKKLGAGFLGGEGFVLQRLHGEGTAWIHAGGDFVSFELAEGQEIRVDTGCVVWFDESVSYDIEKAGGFKTMLFGGEGLFLAKLRGPGHVALQSMPFGKLASSIAAAAFTPGQEEGSGLMGGLLG